jgi:hypothetical protein
VARKRREEAGKLVLEDEMRLSLFVMTVALLLATIAGQGALI